MANEEVAETLEDWRQGDVILSDIELPLLDKGENGDEATIYLTNGALVLTQSCDIVRDYVKKPFLHIAALASVTEDEMRRIATGREIRYLYVPVLHDSMTVADLDLTATVDKRVFLGREKLDGCSTDQERRLLAAQIARHRQRFAFPDDFNQALKPLRRWVERGAGKDSPNGHFIDAISEIRVTTTSWDNPEELEFICIIPHTTPQAIRELWRRLLPSLESKASSDWCRECNFRISTLREMSAEEYLQSDRLDLDGLSDA